MKAVAWKAFALVAAAAGAALATGSASADGAAARGKTLVAGDLRPLLEGLGYETHELAPGLYQAWVERPGKIRYFLTVSLSHDGRFLRLDAPLLEVPPVDAVPAARLQALLVENARFGTIGYEVSGPTFHLVSPVANRAVTPAVARKAIESLMGAVHSQEPVWDFSAWLPKPPDTEPAMKGAR